MTDTQGGEATSVETTPDAAALAALSSQDTSSERNYEEEAAAQGWRPKDEWTGKPEHWKDAKTYVEHGDVKAKLDKLEKEFEKRVERIEKMNGKTIEQLQRQHAKELAELKADKREAVKSGDVDAVEKLDAAIERHKEAAPDKEPAEDPAAVQEAWVAKQSWWDKDEDMTAFAIGVSQNILKKNPDITMSENLRQTEEALKKKFPEQFGGKREAGANRDAPVDSGGAFPNARPNTNTLFAKLPPEAQRQFKLDVEGGHYSAKDGEKWAKLYFGK